MNMEGENDKLICQICGKKYSSVSAKYCHLRDVHKEEPGASKHTVHLKCPICPEEEKIPLESHDMLTNHLQQIHSLSIKTTLITFKNEEEFETWRAIDNRNVDYVKRRYRKTSDGLVVYYECNSSNYTGFISQSTKRSMKAGGSIKISGYCPSRIRVKISRTAVEVKFVETHVGHENLHRSKQLTKDQQEMIASKLAAGVTKERILEDSRTITNNKLERINVFKRADLAYIIRKFNIKKRRHDDDMVATTVKTSDDDESNNLHICLPSTSRADFEMDVQSMISESSHISNDPIESTTELGIILEQARFQLGLLEESNIRNIAKIISEAYNSQCNNTSSENEFPDIDPRSSS